MTMTINDAEGLRAAVAQVEVLSANSAPDDERVRAARRQVVRRARVLNLSSLVPSAWSVAPIVAAASEPIEVPSYERVLTAKAEQSQVPVDNLRRVYLASVREYAMLSTKERPPFSREVFAQAKVNTAIREREVW